MGVFDELNNNVFDFAFQEWDARIQIYTQTELVENKTLELRQCD